MKKEKKNMKGNEENTSQRGGLSKGGDGGLKCNVPGFDPVCMMYIL